MAFHENGRSFTIGWVFLILLPALVGCLTQHRPASLAREPLTVKCRGGKVIGFETGNFATSNWFIVEISQHGDTREVRIQDVRGNSDYITTFKPLSVTCPSSLTFFFQTRSDPIPNGELRINEWRTDSGTLYMEQTEWDWNSGFKSCQQFGPGKIPLRCSK